MSGHSKWATIKRQKGAADARRGQLFTKLSMAITIAVREGGGITDSASNFKLRLAVDKARAANMPKDNIERAISRAAGSGADSFIETIYEGFAPDGVAVVVLAATDNKQRTYSEIKNLFDKNGGTLGSSGSVSYLFTHMGELIIEKGEKSMDDLLSLALEAGIEDIEEEGSEVYLYTEVANLAAAKKSLESLGLVVKSAELVFKPITTVPVVDEQSKQRVISLLEKIEDHQDVQKVFTNADFS